MKQLLLISHQSTKVLIEPTPHENVPNYDFSMLSSVEQCPTFGILRYIHNKIPKASSHRNVPLEAGMAMHEAFAAERFCQLRQQWLRDDSTIPSAEIEPRLDKLGESLFKAERYYDHLKPILFDTAESFDVAKRNFCLAALQTSGFYDDPDDPKRSLSNLESALIKYIDDRSIYTEDVYVSPDYSIIGIENKFCLGVSISRGELLRPYKFNFVGRIDGIHLNKKGQIVIEENKTTGAINKSWRVNYLLSHQLTGYIIAARVLTGSPIGRADVVGTCIIPTQKWGFVSETVEINRNETNFRDWATWLVETIAVINEYKDSPATAPKYTHSCGRYFSSCMFLEYCENTLEDRQELYNEYESQVWDPLSDD